MPSDAHAATPRSTVAQLGEDDPAVARRAVHGGSEAAGVGAVHGHLQVVIGRLAVVARGREHAAQAFEVLGVLGSDDEARARAVQQLIGRPLALQFESLIETMFTLAAEGKTNRKGLPNPLRLAVIAKAHFDTVRLPFPPEWLQRTALAVGAPLGRLLGYRATAASTVPA
jgi:hypothetical protein